MMKCEGSYLEENFVICTTKMEVSHTEHQHTAVSLPDFGGTMVGHSKWGKAFPSARQDKKLLGELAAEKATAAGNQGAEVIRTSNDKVLEKNLGIREERKG